MPRRSRRPVDGGACTVRLSRKPNSARTLPSVNILSPWVFEAIATRRLRRRFVLAGCALSLLIAAGWVVQELRVNQAEGILTVEQVEGARLSSQTQALAPVRVYVATVEQQKLTVQTAMATEVYFSRVLEGLRATTPDGVVAEAVAVTVAPPAPVVDPGAAAAAPTVGATSACPGPDPFHTLPVVGCIALSGSADTRGVVGEFVINLGGSDLFVEPFISTTTASDGDSVMFTGSVGLSQKVFSERYADLDWLLAPGGDR